MDFLINNIETVSIVTIFQMSSDVNILFDIFMSIYYAKRWSSALCHEKGFKSTAIMPKIQ